MHTPHRTTPRTRAAAVGAGIAAAAILTGCASAAAPADDRPQVVATTTQLGDIAREIAGDAAAVTQLLQPGQSAHGFDPTPQALQALAAADVLVVNGAGLEAWLDDTIAASGFDATVVDVSDHVHLHVEGDDPAHAHEHAAHDHDAEHAEAQAGEDAGLGEASGDDHAHDHGGVDPHLWTDPHNAIHMAEAVGTALAAADPEHADEYGQRTSDYLDRLHALDEWIHASVDQVPEPERLLVTSHDTFSYFAEAYGITTVGAVMPAFDDNAEPSAAEMDALIAQIRATGARAVFAESSIDARLAETIARDAGVRVFAGDDALYADSLGAPGSAGDTYIGSHIHNVSRIVESWGATPLPVPDALVP